MTDGTDRGGRWVLAQVPLMALAVALGFVGPRMPVQARGIVWPIGLALLAGGLALFGSGVLVLGRNLTPFPRPKDDGVLVRTGAFALVRHPLYSGGIIASLGWALVTTRPLALLATLALFLFFDAKAGREEVWLEAKFPEYAAYRRDVRKLVPWVY